MRVLLQHPFSVFFSSAAADVHVLLLQCRHRRCISFITVCSLSSGPVMSKFIAAFRELASYRELIRSQVSSTLQLVFRILTYDDRITGHDFISDLLCLMDKFIWQFEFQRELY
ncbi:unnamed protein product [Camellia sinensis]